MDTEIERYFNVKSVENIDVNMRVEERGGGDGVEFVNDLKNFVIDWYLRNFESISIELPFHLNPTQN